MAQKGVIKTHEKFVQDVEDKFPGKYTILGQYTGSTNYLDVIYNECGHKYNTKACKIIAGKGCPVCSGGIKLTQEEFEERINMLFDDYNVIGKYINNVTPVCIKHICGYEFDIIPSNAFGRKQCNCPKCFPNKNHNCIPYVNDIYTTNKELYNLLKNKKEDGHKYKEGSHKNIWFICPDCGTEIYQRPYSVLNYGLNCPNCNSSISFPERLMSIILSDIGIKYKFQFSPKWISPYRYDFEFKVHNIKYIIEMDGGWHYSDNNLSGKTYEETKQRDEYKTEQAIIHGYNIIRIDCDYNGENRDEYIKNNILNSELSNIISFDNLNWDKCIRLANMPLIRQILIEWNNGLKSVSELAHKLHLSDTTIRRYLYMASEKGYIKESIDEIKTLNLQHRLKVYGGAHSNKVICNETKEIFMSFKEAQEKYHCNLTNYFRENNRKFAGTLPDGTRLTWTKI